MCKILDSCVRATIPAFIFASAANTGLLAQNIDSLNKHIEQLTAEWIELTRIADAADNARTRIDSLLASQIPVDTVKIGHLAVIAVGEAIPYIRANIEEVWARIEDRVGGSTELLKSTTFRVELSPVELRDNDPPILGYHVHVGTESIGKLADLATLNSPAGIRESITRALANAVNQQMVNLVPPDLVRWAGSIGPSRMPHDMRRFYVDLIGSPFNTAGACWRRMWDGCRIAMGLAESPDPFREWFDDDDRRALVAIAADRAGFISRANEKTYDLCQTGDDDASCLRLLERWRTQPHALSQMHRQQLVSTALALGGDQAFARLIQTGGSNEERLVASAGVSMDSIFTTWRNRIDEAAGAPVRVTGGTATVTIVWMMAFMFAATRSTRWRYN